MSRSDLQSVKDTLVEEARQESKKLRANIKTLKGTKYIAVLILKKWKMKFLYEILKLKKNIFNILQ